jgi:hypothetical protein
MKSRTASSAAGRDEAVSARRPSPSMEIAGFVTAVARDARRRDCRCWSPPTRLRRWTGPEARHDRVPARGPFERIRPATGPRPGGMLGRVTLCAGCGAGRRARRAGLGSAVANRSHRLRRTGGRGHLTCGRTRRTSSSRTPAEPAGCRSYRSCSCARSAPIVTTPSHASARRISSGKSRRRRA